MRLPILLCATLIVPGVAAGAQGAKARAKSVQKGDHLTVKGCLAGGSLEATEAEGLEGTGLLQEGLTFRLTGEKGLLKELRERHDRHLVSLSGVLKSDLPKTGGESRSVGRMRIRIGGAMPSPNSPGAESRRVLPVLQVTAFEGSETTCGR